MSPSLLLHRLFGCTLSSDFAFASRLGHGRGAPGLTFTAVDPLPPLPAVTFEQRVYPVGPPGRPAEGSLQVYRSRAHHQLDFADQAVYEVEDQRISYALLDPAAAPLVEIQFLGVVMAFWLELQGIHALHASAVVVDGQVAVFLSSHQGGKSGLAAGLMQAGYPLLSDDILAVEQRAGGFVGRPGYPTMRMWPDEAEHFLGHYDSLPLVHPQLSKRRVFVGPAGFGEFCGEAQPLGCLYLPERRAGAGDDGGTRITPVGPRDALLALVRHSFTPRVVEALGHQPARLALFAGLLRRVPVRRLSYPAGFAYLPAVTEAVVRDLAALRRADVL